MSGAPTKRFSLFKKLRRYREIGRGVILNDSEESRPNQRL